ncbi:hypothetical protein PR002_g15059 [Phytophthora rubi]|uniref:Transposase Tc1-like domain-containing protein n=1 Tax=Phytophthora rubi TaxID=129364 RepID=A0A6A3L6R8_9STRA|nr:hypothetical protein PR002_g15059 [Phytophthora rubi]
MPPNLTDDERREILDEMLERSIDGVLPRGLRSELARRWGRARTTMVTLWASYRAAKAGTGAKDAWKSKIKQKSGRKRKGRAATAAKLRAIPVGERQVVRQVATRAGVTRYMVAALQKEGTLARRTSRIKPALTHDNKLHRLEFALAHVDESSMTFEPMLDVIHVDEKWFNADKDKRSYLVFEDEMPPPRFFKSKRFIPKTMFLAAFARPRQGCDCKQCISPD